MRTAASPQILPHLPIDRATGVPLHRQIYEGIRRAILGGLLRPGQRVPSTRMLAVELEVSRLPVLTAYDQLLHEGYLEGRVGSGTFVSAALPDDALRSVPIAERGKRAAATRQATQPASPASRSRPAATPRPRDEGGLRPFRVSLPALDEFPHAAWSRLVARHAHSLTPALMAYGDPAGLGTLRAAIAEHLRTARAVRCEAGHVLIVSGSQAALRLCAAVLLARGDRVAIEEPGYPLARAALGASGAELAPVVVDDEGLDIGALSSLGALQGMDRHGRVIYLGTFSKVLFPSLRVGYVVVPPLLWQAFVEAREALDIFSPTLYQLALVDFLREGHFARHLRRMRALYLRRREALLDGLARHCDGRLVVHNADAGLHIATLLPIGVDDVEVVSRMAEHGLTATALSTCYAGSTRRSGLLLGFGGSSERRIAAATRTLGEILRVAVKRRA